MPKKAEILEVFAPLFGGTGGIDSWLNEETPESVFSRLSEIEISPLPRAQLDQLLVLCHEAGVSQAFFKYYWLSTPVEHPYDVTTIDGFDRSWLHGTEIASVDHLRWGLYRLYLDALLFYGNIRTAYRDLRSKASLEAIFSRHRFPTDLLKARGAALPLNQIAKDDRYLVSEMACKSYDIDEKGTSDLKTALIEAWRVHCDAGDRKATIRELLEDDLRPREFEARRVEMVFSADAILDQEVAGEGDIEAHCDHLARQFLSARSAAIQNTQSYLSMVNELDVYVATSMRTRQDFRDMADTCDEIFHAPKLAPFDLRYFDPTLSAADGHEDKGLIECLMVKSAKVLVYIAGRKESYGKDAEAAMALSLGKPVIFLCDEESQSNFYRDVHPLARLIDFETGVAVGAIVTSNKKEVVELLRRIFENQMEYAIEQSKPGHFRLIEQITKSVIRIQTSDKLLRETFWNYYHRDPPTSGMAT